ncbi:MAG: hypothetical protein KQJ78_06020 [Deltaproteobacteria bacterium]|nr:hypothetical protein [Deltaproteobacteria bacterium]
MERQAAKEALVAILRQARQSQGVFGRLTAEQLAEPLGLDPALVRALAAELAARGLVVPGEPAGEEPAWTVPEPAPAPAEDPARAPGGEAGDLLRRLARLVGQAPGADPAARQRWQRTVREWQEHPGLARAIALLWSRTD